MSEARDSKGSSAPELRVLRDLGAVANLEGDPSEGLRERKKRLTRQQISDTATGMFLEHGFDEVRVADVAAACGVSEKTVYNYFPTKESLLLDREPEMIELVRRSLGADAPEGSPVDAFGDELSVSIAAMVRAGAELPESVSAADVMHRFRELIETTPSLRAAQRDMMDRITRIAAEELAARAGVDPLEPEPQIAAAAICALWGVMHRALVDHAGMTEGPEVATAEIIDEVRRAARLIDTGLWSFGLAVQGTTSLKQFKQAADAANEARKQVVVAVRAAKSAWEAVAEVRAQQMDAVGRGRGGHGGGPKRGRGSGDRGGGPNRARGAGRGPVGGRGAGRGPADVAAQSAAVQEQLRSARREAVKAQQDVKAATRDVAQATAKLRAAARDAKRKR
jgi:AcrR family transcriptional regulator